MRRIAYTALALMLLLSLCACGGGRPEPTAEPAVSQQVQTPEPTAVPTAAPTPEPTPEPLFAGYAETQSDWAGLYRQYVEDNFDIIAALWPEGMSGVGFVDLDIDGMPEMLLFDMGASATLGLQIFDIVDGAVACVSSVNEAAAAAFGDTHFSGLSVCASYFEDFRLLENGGEVFFTVKSANGTLESCWEEQLRFVRGEGDVLTLASLYRLETESDVENGTIASEHFYAGGTACSLEEYQAAAALVEGAQDLGYEAAGLFLWNDMERYDTSLEGLLVMLEDAAAAYVPIR